MHMQRIQHYRPRLIISAILTALLALLVLAYQPFKTSAQRFGQSAPTSSNIAAQAALENYDIRADQSEEVRAALAAYRREAALAIADSVTRHEMQEAATRLALLVPELNVEWNESSSAPEIVGVSGTSRAMLTKPSLEPREKIVRDFLAEHHALYGLNGAQAAGLRKISDYSNPAGNLSWVEFQQEINGLPVFQGELRAALTRRGELGRTISNLASALDDGKLPTKPQTDFADAVVAGAAAIGIHLKRSDVRVETRVGGRAAFESKAFSDEGRVELQYFPLEQGVARLAWAMVLWQHDASYYVLVDAQTGRLLFRKCITYHQTQAASYSVYDNDSPAPLSPSTALPGMPVVVPGISRTTLTLVSELQAFDNLGWITDGENTTTGNNVDAGLDVELPDGIDPNGRPVGNPFRVFSFDYSPPPIGNTPTSDANYRFGSVANLFFWGNRFHDRLYQAGFTEPARNCQNDNFGRGGLGGDRLIIELESSSSTPSVGVAPDGTSPKLIEGAATSLDQEATLHELTHIVSSRLHANGTGLGGIRAGSMGEGWSDFYARSLVSSADENLDGVYALYAYLSAYAIPFVTDPYYYGIRRFPYALKTSLGANGKPHNPLTLADIDPAQINTTDGAYPPASWLPNSATEVHNAGEVWCLALLEVRARLIRRLGFAEGNRRMMQLVVDGMKLEPVNPRFIQGRDAILSADQLGFGGADTADIWAGFAARGMGFGAQDLGMAVIESFVNPTPPKPVADFDGDGKTDLSVFRSGTWFVQGSSSGFFGSGFGLGSDRIVPGDYDGDGKADFAVFRPSNSTWYILRSSNGSMQVIVWGTSGDMPLTGDYDGDGKADAAVYRPGSNTFFVQRSSDGALQAQAWGISGDVPVAGDFDGDNKTDFVVYRSGTWYVLGSAASFSATSFGLSGDRLVPADYDGDNRTDYAVFRSGTWYLLRSTAGFTAVGWGLSTDSAVPGDYDGDGKDDIGVFRDGTWYVIGSTSGTATSFFGTTGDVAVPSAYLP